MTVKNCEKIEKSQVAMTVEVSAAEFEAALEKAYLKMRKQIKIPGFRPGKAPRKMIESMYGAEVFFEEAINIAFPEAYEAAVEEKRLQVVGYPSVEMVGEATREGFTFKATTPVYPEVKLGKYKGLKAPKETVKVSAADVNSRLQQLADRNTRLVSVDRAAKNGDTAVIDFEGFLNGKAFAGGKGENHPLELGSGTFIPGFEEQVVGMKAGEEKDVNVTFPKEYTPELAGKDAVFKVKVHEVKEKEVPEMDDEFAKDVSEFDTMKDLKADLKRQITEERQKEIDRKFEDDLMTKVAEGVKADIPDVMIEDQARRFVENFKRQISQQFSYEDYKKMSGMDEQKLLDDAKEPAERQVRMDLAVAAIIKAEKIEASDEDVEAEYADLAKQYNMDVEMVKKYLTADQIREQLVTKKAIAVVTESATAEKAAAKEAPAEEKAEKKPAAKKASAKKEAAAEKKPAAKKASAKKEAAAEKKPAAKKSAKKAEK